MSLSVCKPDGPSAPELMKTCPHLALSNLQNSFPDAEPLKLIFETFRITAISTNGWRRGAGRGVGPARHSDRSYEPKPGRVGVSNK